MFKGSLNARLIINESNIVCINADFRPDFDKFVEKPDRINDIQKQFIRHEILKHIILRLRVQDERTRMRWMEPFR